MQEKIKVMALFGNKNNWLQIVTDRLDRSSGAGTVEISIRHEDVTVNKFRIENNGQDSCSWTEDWLGNNVTMLRKADVVHLARLTILKIAEKSGWLLVRDGVEVLIFEDGQRIAKAKLHDDAMTSMKAY